MKLSLQRALPAAPRHVFEAFSDPRRLSRWWGPAGFTIPSARFEPSVGESYRIEMLPPEGEAFFLAGEFRAVEPPHRLAFTFSWEEPDPDDVVNLVELAFRDLHGSTEVALVQHPFRTEARLALHREGWGESFDKLEALLRS